MVSRASPAHCLSGHCDAVHLTMPGGTFSSLHGHEAAVNKIQTDVRAYNDPSHLDSDISAEAQDIQ